MALISLGCPKNLVDSEIMLGMLRKNNFIITNQPSEAEGIIVNTCGFTNDAKEESINSIFEMLQFKADKCKTLMVTGCLAERYRDEINKEIPEVDAVIGTGSIDKAVSILKSSLSGASRNLYTVPQNLDYLEKERVLSTSGYAYLKIAEGCDNRCTYCIIPDLRGGYRSRRIENIVSEAERIAEAGIKEIILVAQDTTRYGIDIYNEKRIVPLIKELSSIEKVKWIRLLYCYPEMIGDELIEEMASNKKLLNYLDIPIQHASNRILKLMGRRDTSEEIENLLNKLREKVDGIILRTSVITGFPGETRKDFTELYDFLERMEFDRLGVFEYSREEGTPAFDLPGQIDDATKHKRKKELMDLQYKVNMRKNQKRVRKVYEAMLEGIADDGIFYYGRTYGESPEIDGQVYFTARNVPKFGGFVKIKILDVQEYDLIGDVIDESSQ